MSAPKSNATKWEAERVRMQKAAEEQDERRQQQIANQVEIINRLMAEGQAYKFEAIGANKTVLGIMRQQGLTEVRLSSDTMSGISTDDLTISVDVDVMVVNDNNPPITEEEI